MAMLNKRGSFGVANLSVIFILVLVIVVLSAGEHKIDASTVNKTIETLNWTKIGGNVSASLQRTADNQPNEIVKVLLNVIDKAVDFYGYTIFAIAKLAMELARDHPDIINYRVLFALVILSLLAPVVYPLFMIVTSIFILLHEWVVTRREKRILREKMVLKT